MILVLGKIGFASPLKNFTLNNSEMSTNAVDGNVWPSFTLGDPTYSRKNRRDPLYINENGYFTVINITCSI